MLSTVFFVSCQNSPCPCLRSVFLSVFISLSVPISLCPFPCWYPCPCQCQCTCQCQCPCQHQCLLSVGPCLLSSIPFHVGILPWLFQWPLATDNFWLIYCQKNLWITLKVTFVAKGQLSVLISYNPKGERQRITFCAYFDSFNGPYQRKLMFDSNLPSSAVRTLGIGLKRHTTFMRELNGQQ